MHYVPYKTCEIVMADVAGMMGVLASGTERHNGASSSLGRGSKTQVFNVSLLLSFSPSTA